MCVCVLFDHIFTHTVYTQLDGTYLTFWFTHIISEQCTQFKCRSFVNCHHNIIFDQLLPLANFTRMYLLTPGDL